MTPAALQTCYLTGQMVTADKDILRADLLADIASDYAADFTLA